MNKSVVYKISNSVDDRIYIGSTSNYRCRKAYHTFQLRNGFHHSKQLQSLVDIHGIGILIFSIIENCDKDKLVEREQFFIDQLNPKFNTCTKAGSMDGFKPSKEHVNILIESRSNDLVRKKMSDSAKNRWASLEKPFKQSEETIKKRSESLKRYFQNKKTINHN